MADHPSAWADAQREFRETYSLDPTGLPRCAVHWRLIEGGPDPYGAGVLGFAGVLRWATSRAARRKPMQVSLLLAVWPNEAPAGAEADLVFEVEPSSTDGDGEGVLVGDIAPNAALCIETSTGEVFWPTDNPRLPLRGAPRR